MREKDPHKQEDGLAIRIHHSPFFLQGHEHLHEITTWTKVLAHKSLA